MDKKLTVNNRGGGHYTVLITNDKGNRYYQNTNGLVKITNPYSAIPLFRIGNRFVPKQDVALMKLLNPDLFFRRVYTKLGHKNVQNRRFTSQSKIFLVFNTKNHRNVIKYYNIKSLFPNIEALYLKNNKKMENAKLRFGTHASTIQKKLKNLVKKRIKKIL